MLLTFQSKAMKEIVSAVDTLISGGNVSALFAPAVDGFINEGDVIQQRLVHVLRIILLKV